MDCIYFCLWRETCSSSATIVSGCLVSTAISILSRSATCRFEKFVTCIQNGICFRPLGSRWGGSNLFISFSVLICSMAISPSSEVIKITGDSVHARTVSCFRLKSSHFPVLRDWTPWATFCSILDMSLSLFNIGTGAECMGTIFLSMGMILLIQRSIWWCQVICLVPGFQLHRATYVLERFPSSWSTE